MQHLCRLALGLAILFVTPTWATSMPSDCERPPMKGARWMWARGARVSVTIDSEFVAIPGGHPAIVEALRRWELASGNAGNGSGVTFNVLANGEAPPAGPTLRISRGTLRTGGQARTALWSSDGAVVRASCVIDTRVDHPVALLQVTVHELGHTFGLAECDTCETGSSAMTRSSGVDYNDTTSGTGWPSPCDNAAVRANGGY